MNMPTWLLAVLETSINRYIQQDPDNRATLVKLQGKVIAVELLGFDSTLYFFSLANKIQVMGQYEGSADTRIRGTPLSLLKLGASTGESAKDIFAGDVEIIGDTEVGQWFQRLLKETEFDWEEHLSKWTGDMAAHQVSRWFRATTEWGKHTLDALRLDTKEYLQEESRLLVTEAELTPFYQSVDQLRSRVDRLQARVKRLQTKLSAASES